VESDSRAFNSACGRQWPGDDARLLASATTATSASNNRPRKCGRRFLQETVGTREPDLHSVALWTESSRCRTTRHGHSGTVGNGEVKVFHSARGDEPGHAAKEQHRACARIESTDSAPG